MSLPAYAEYKDSGVEWLGDVPKHWPKMALKWKARIRSGDGISPYQIDAAPSDDRRVPVFGGNGIMGYTRLDNINKPSIVIGRVGALCGNIHKVDVGVWVSDNALCLDFNDGFYNVDYLSILLEVRNLNDIADKSAQPLITGSKVLNQIIPCPPLPEQTTIARFLDHETAKIDALIAEQQRLIELLKEKRQAVISHAVTKGLNPNAPMKDSGVAWLGDVPEHWDVVSSKFLYEFVTSGSRGWADFYADEGDLFFRIANLTRDTIEPKMESIQFVNAPSGAEGERSKIRKGDLLISITADLGSVCVADDQITGGYVSQHVALTRPNSKVKCSRWFAYAILSNASKEQLIGYGYGGTKVQLSLEDIKSICMVLPSESDQLAISEYLDAFIHNVNCLMTEAEHTVSLLKERRSALISAAVTGKIDVRGWQPPTTAATTPQGQQQILFDD